MTRPLSDVIDALGLLVTERPTEIVLINDVEHDSRRVRPGALFACVPGALTDGHLHAGDAVDRGAVAILGEHRLGLGVPEIVVDSVRRALGPAAATVHDHPSDRLDVVGITGTNGKTTTVRLLFGVLRALGGEVHEIGTLTGVRTTPEAPELQRELLEAANSGASTVAMEVSSHALDLHRVDGTRFRVVAFTNLGMDHLDHHGSVEAYFDAKASLFTPELADFAVIDGRSAAGERLARRCTIPHFVIDGQSVGSVESGLKSSSFRWRDLMVELPLGGAFNVSNAVLAAEIAVRLGHEPSDIAAALADCGPVPGRFEHIDEGQDFTVIVDYAHTPDGLAAVLETAREVTIGRLVVVFGAGGDRDRGKRPRMGGVARRLADCVVVTSDNPRSEDPTEIIAAIVSGMDRPPDLIESDRRAAIRHAIAGARPGDVVVVAGKGHETTQTIGDEATHFDDRLVARDELQRHATRST